METIPTTLPESWFIERIGKNVMAKSSKAFNGEMLVTDERHAKYLCNVAQKHLNYRFSELPKPQPNATK